MNLEVLLDGTAITFCKTHLHQHQLSCNRFQIISFLTMTWREHVGLIIKKHRMTIKLTKLKTFASNNHKQKENGNQRKCTNFKLKYAK